MKRKMRKNRLITILMALVMSVFSVPKAIEVLADTTSSEETSTTTSIGDKELWNSETNDFNYSTVEEVLQYLAMSNGTQSSYPLDTIYDRARVVSTNNDLWTYFVGSDKVSSIDKTQGYFTIGGLKWYPTYLSTDKNGDPVLTLWLAQDQLPTATLNITEEKCVYGTSALRSSVLANSKLSLFTDSTLGFTDYINTPSQMEWQEYQSVWLGEIGENQDMISIINDGCSLMKKYYLEDEWKAEASGLSELVIMALIANSCNNDAWSTNVVGAEKWENELKPLYCEMLQLFLESEQEKIDAKKTELAELKETNQKLTENNENLTAENTQLQSQIDASEDETEKANLQAKITANQTTITNNNSTITSNNTKITSLEKEIESDESIMEGNEASIGTFIDLFDKDLYGVDPLGNTYSFLEIDINDEDVSNASGVVYQNEVGYSKWKDDYIWLPSASEAYSASNSGLWSPDETLTSSTNELGTILRSANRNGYVSINATGEGVSYHSTESEEASVNIRPAFNLNLGKVIDACVNKCVDNLGQDEANEYVASMTQYARIGELWDSENQTFNEENLNKLYSYISGSLDASYETIESMLTSTKTYYDAQDFKSQTVTGLKYNHQNILVTIGGYDWHVMYMSDDKSGNPTLTLWMANSFNVKDSHKRMQCIDLLTYCMAGGYNSGLAEDNGVYGNSLLRAWSLNNGGKIINDDMSSMLNFAKDEDGNMIIPVSTDSPFALFTSDTLGFTDFVTTPRNISWQENTQYYNQIDSNGEKTQVNRQYANDSWSNVDIKMGDDTTYTMSDKAHVSDWADDYLWIPSVSEAINITVGSTQMVGIWNSSVEQLKNYDGETNSFSSVFGDTPTETLFRTVWYDTYNNNNKLYGLALSADGTTANDNISNTTSEAGFIRPAMHLNLSAINEEMESGASQGLVIKTTKLEYTGLDMVRDIKFTYSKNALTYGTDYTLNITKVTESTSESVSSMVEVGSYKVVFTPTVSSGITLGEGEVSEFDVEIIPQTILKKNITITQKPILNDDYSLNHYEADIVVKDALGNEVSPSNYTVTYSNNTTVNSTADAYIVFSGNYTGSYEISFTTTLTQMLPYYDDYKIEIMSGEDVWYTFDGSNYSIPGFTYDGNAHKLTLGKVYYKGTLLTEGVDYYYYYKFLSDYPIGVYEVDADADESYFVYNKGVTIMLLGIGKYASIDEDNSSGTILAYNIKGIDITDDAEVTWDTDTFEWDGTARCPKYTIIYDGVTYVLNGVAQEVEGTKVWYRTVYSSEAHNVADDHSVTVQMSSPKYTFKKDFTFSVTPIDLKDAVLSKDSKTAFAYYNGEAPKLNITLERQKDENSKKIVIKLKEVTTTSGEEGKYFYTFTVADIESVGDLDLREWEISSRFKGEITIPYTIVGSKDILNVDFGENGLELEYDQSKKTPKPTITNTSDNSVLVEGTDYTITYGENTNVTDESWLEIVYQGKYRGTYKYDITITPIKIENCTAFFEQNEFEYDGNSHTLLLSVKYVNSAGKTIDKTFSKVTPRTYAGTFEVIFDDEDFGPNYTGTYEGEYTITRVEITAISSMTNLRGDRFDGYYNYYDPEPKKIGIKFDKGSTLYWFSEIENAKLLRNGVETTDLVSLGTIDVQLSGNVGSGYVLNQTLSFSYEIKPNYVSKVYIDLDDEDAVYSGKPLSYYEQFVYARLVTDTSNIKVSERDYWSVAFYKYSNGSVVGEPLSLDTIANAGTYQVVVSGNSDVYTGSANALMKIVRKDINDLYGIRYYYVDESGNLVDQYGTISSDKTYVTATGKLYKGIIFTGEISGLTLDTDYKVEGEWVEENVSYKVTITGLGNYYSTNTLTLNVEPKNIEDEDVVLVEDFQENGYTYTGKTADIYEWFTLRFGTKTLVEDTDIRYSFSPKLSADVGTYTVTITGIQNYTGTRTYSYEILPKNIQDSDITIGEYSETMEYSEGMNLRGYKIKHGDDVVSSIYYTVSVNGEENEYISYVIIGVNTIVITGKGNYTGTITFTRTVTKGTFARVTPVASGVYSVSITFDTNGKTEEEIISLFKFETKKGSSIPTKYLDFEYSIWNSESETYVPFNGYSLRFVDVGKYQVKATALETSKYTGTQTFNFEITQKEINPFILSVVENDDRKILFARSWTGSQITIVDNDFDRRIYDGEYALVAGTDFTYACADEELVDLGMYEITITGIGNYSGSETVNFVIEYAKEELRIKNIADVTYTGEAFKPQVIIMYSGRVIEDFVEGKDYDVMYTNNTNTGRAEVSVISRVSYLDSTNLVTSFQILPRSVKDEAVNASGWKTNYAYDGTAHTPVVTLTYNEMTLTENTDYTVAYGENINAGKGTITINGKGNYGDTKTIEFTIDPKSIDGLITISDIASSTFTGSPITPEPSLTFTAETLVADTDYEVSYADNTNVGTAKYIITGKGNYGGTIEKAFTITTKELENTMLSGVESSYTYTGSAITPSVTMKFGEIPMVVETDYTVAYANNTNVGTATIAITGNGNYSGEITKTFEITAKALENTMLRGVMSSYTYTGSAITPSITMNFNSIVMAKDTDYTVVYANNTEVGTATITVTGKGNYSGEITKTFEITAKALENTMLSGVNESYTYTGSAITPVVTMKYDTITMILNEDYTVAYANNTNVGTATITVTGKGNYSGETTKTFTITEKEITLDMLSGVESSYTYTGSAITPVVTMTFGEIPMVVETDYTVAYANNTNVGTATITVTGKGNYSGEITKTFTITEKEITLDMLSGINESYTYTGSAITPSVVMKYDEVVMVKDTDYTVAYTNNTDVGTATITITGNGNYSGEITKTFAITTKALENTMLSGVESSYTYTGSAITPSVTMTFNSVAMTLDTDYTVTYTGNTDVGTATITVTGTGNYSGEITKTFTITTKALENAMLSGVESSYTYTGSAITPVVTMKYGTITMVLGDDYTVAYANNTNVGTATITVTGKGNYSGSIEKTFTITEKTLEETMLSGVNESYTYTGSAITPVVTMTFNSIVMTKDTDYTVAYVNNTNVGTATITVTGKGNYSGETTKTFTITEKEITLDMLSGVESSYTYTGSAITPVVTMTFGEIPMVVETDYTVAYTNNTEVGTATITISGTGNYSGSIEKTFTITEKTLEETMLSGINESYTYTGSAITPSVVMTFNSMTMTKDTDYTVAYVNNTNVGTATITISGTGNYSGSIEKTFAITEKTLENTMLSGIESSYTYTGSAITPVVTMTFGETPMVVETDYTVAYTNNTNVGTATITITGKGNYSGEITKTFTITEKEITLDMLSGINESYTYTGSAITPVVTMKYDEVVMVKDTDYTVAYTNNTNVGTATITISGTGNYSGSIEKTFAITEKTLEETMLSGINESYTYTGSAITPVVTMKYGTISMVVETDYTVVYANNTNVGTATITITGKGNYSGKITKTFAITEKALALDMLSGVDNSYTYTGSAITPIVTMKFGEIPMVVETDYTVAYANNTNVGTATITISGTGNYSGSIEKTFAITEKTLEETMLSGINESYTYTGSAITPVVTMKYDTITMVLGTDYTVVYANNTNVGTATITVTGTGNYSGEITKTFTITEKEITLDMLSGINESYTYTGSAITPSVVMKYDEVVMVKDTDYTVAYTNNTDVGTATITVTGTGNYSGKITKTFGITEKEITLDMLSGVESNYVYTGSAITPVVTMKYDEVVMVKDTDYTVAYTNNTNVGTATITISGTGNYSGSIEKTFTITEKTLEETMLSGVNESYTYTGSAITPVVTMTFNSVAMTLDTDYTVAYTGNTDVGTATITISGTGNYSGSITKTFAITEKALEETMLSGINESYTYTGSAITPSVVMKFGEVAMTLDTDYTVTYTNNTNVGTATITITGNGNYSGEITKTFAITEKTLENTMLSGIESSYTYTGSAITPVVTMTFGETPMVVETDYTVAYTNNTNVGTATITITGKGNYSGEITKTFTITEKEITLDMLSGINESYVYTGSAITPVVTMKFGEIPMVVETDYTVAYTNNTNVGTATITITGIGNYSGTISKTFSIAKVALEVSVELEDKSAKLVENGDLPKLKATVSGNVSGTIEYVKKDEKLSSGEHEYEWIFTPDDLVNYDIVTGSIVLDAEAETSNSMLVIIISISILLLLIIILLIIIIAKRNEKRRKEKESLSV